MREVVTYRVRQRYEALVYPCFHPINLPLGHVIPFVEHAMHDTKAEVSEYS
jgi:hypothetical protein